MVLGRVGSLDRTISHGSRPGLATLPIPVPSTRLGGVNRIQSLRGAIRFAALLHLVLAARFTVGASEAHWDRDPIRVGLLTAYRGDLASKVVISGDHAFVGAGTIQVISLKDKTQPIVVGDYGDYTRIEGDLVLAGTVLYAGRGPGGLEIVDVSEPTRPLRLAQFGDHARAVAVNGNRACINTLNSIVLLDIGEPTHPKKLGECWITALGNAPIRGLAISGDHVFVANSSNGLAVVDFRVPTDPRVVGAFGTSGSAVGIRLVGTTGYIVTTEPELEIWDLANPSEPSRIGQIATTGIPSGVTVEGTLAYVALGSAGMEIVDVRDPSQPGRIGAFQIPSTTVSDIAVHSGVACVAGLAMGTYVVDVTEPSHPRSLGGTLSARSSHDIALAPPYAYLASARLGLQVIDISDPTQPRLIGQCEDASNARKLVLDGHHAYVASSTGTVHVVDITDPTNPVRIAGWETLGGTLGIRVKDGLAYVMAGTRGVQVTDVADPANPRILSADLPVWTTVYPRDIAVVGRHVLITDRFAGIRVFDVRDPSKPRLQTTFPAPGATSMAVSSTHAYVLVEVSLTTIDISNPASMFITDQRHPALAPSGVSIGGNFVTVFDSNHAVTVFDISVADSPKQVGWSPTIFQPYGVAIDGTRAYVAMNPWGLEVIDFSRQSHLQVLNRSEDMFAGVAVFVQDTTAYFVDIDQLFRIVDVGDPAQPRTLGSTPYQGFFPLSTVVSGGHAFIAGQGGLAVVDISDRSQPKFVQRINMLVQDATLATAGNLLYMVASPSYPLYESQRGNDGFLVYDITTPSNTVRLSRLKTTGHSHEVAVRDTHGYLADGPGGLAVLDLSNPLETTVIHRVPDTSGAIRVTLSDCCAFVLGTPDGVAIFDITDPVAPRRLGAFAQDINDTSGPVSPHLVNLALLGNLALVGSGWGSIGLFDVSDTSNPAHIGNFTSDLAFLFGPGSVYKDSVLILSNGPPLAFRPVFRSWTREDDALRIHWLAPRGTRLQALSPESPGGWKDIPGSRNATEMTLPATSIHQAFRLTSP